MEVQAHAAFGIFTGVLGLYLTGDWIFGVLLFVIQIGLVLDFLFKKHIHFEPLHTLMAGVIVWGISLLAFPAYHWAVFIGYFSHFFLDLFVDEKIPLLYPLNFHLNFPLPYSEDVVVWGSVFGTVATVILIIL
jgi:membrane-bound metal-dependent hydrolase YbcI (DUF457 family)